MAIQKITDYVITDNAVDGTKIAMGSDAAGDVLYYDGTNYVRLGKGTAGQALVMNAGATAPEWGAGSSSSSNSGVVTQRLIVTENNTTGRTGTWVKPTGVTSIEVELVGTGRNGGQDASDGQGTPIAGATGPSSAAVHNTIDVRDITSIQFIVGHQTNTSPDNGSNTTWGVGSYFGTNTTLPTTNLTVNVDGSGAITTITNPGANGSGLTGSHVPIMIEATPNAATGNMGTGATAIATVSGGAVTGITVTNGGSGYVAGQVTAIFGMGSLQSTVWGGAFNKSASRTALLYTSGYGGGGTGQPAGGGQVGFGKAGAIYIKEYR